MPPVGEAVPVGPEGLRYGISGPVDASAAARTEGRLRAFIGIDAYPVGGVGEAGEIAGPPSLLQREAATPFALVFQLGLAADDQSELVPSPPQWAKPRAVCLGPLRRHRQAGPLRQVVLR